MYLSEKYGIHHYLYEYFVRDVIIFIITLSQRCYFTCDLNADIRTYTDTQTHTHTHTCKLYVVQGHSTDYISYVVIWFPISDRYDETSN